MSITVIRHKVTKTGFNVVVTAYVSDGAVFQMYSTTPTGSTTLDIEESYSTESSAIERFDEVVS